MASTGTYYLDTASLSNATAVFTDALLTTKAADGWYQSGNISRRQVAGVLVAGESACVSCDGPRPTVNPPIPPVVTTQNIQIKECGGTTIFGVQINVSGLLVGEAVKITDPTGFFNEFACWEIINDNYTGIIEYNVSYYDGYIDCSDCGLSPTSQVPYFYKLISCNPSISDCFKSFGGAPTTNQTYVDGSGNYYYYDGSAGVATSQGAPCSPTIQMVNQMNGCPTSNPIYYLLELCASGAPVFYRTQKTTSEISLVQNDIVKRNNTASENYTVVGTTTDTSLPNVLVSPNPTGICN